MYNNKLNSDTTSLYYCLEQLLHIIFLYIILLHTILLYIISLCLRFITSCRSSALLPCVTYSSSSVGSLLLLRVDLISMSRAFSGALGVWPGSGVLASRFALTGRVAWSASSTSADVMSLLLRDIVPCTEDSFLCISCRRLWISGVWVLDMARAKTKNVNLNAINHSYILN